MTSSSYIIAWIIYLLAASGISFIVWNLSRQWRIELKYISRISLLVLLFTPYFSDPEQNRLAPAILISLFELVFGDKQMGLESATPLVLIWAVSAAIALLYILTRRSAK